MSDGAGLRLIFIPAIRDRTAGSAALRAKRGRFPDETVSDEKVQRVHYSRLLIDTHNDVTSRTVDGFDFGVEKFQKRTMELQRTMPKATLDDLVDNIEHVKKIAGIDAVGIGTDFTDWYCMPKGLENASKFPNLTRRLLERGFSAEASGRSLAATFWARCAR